ncbi:MAG: flavodoxin family protein [Sphaerochaeta sp.]|jgi:multimeric flavodoxin WrbA|nr:flavodoxin family protein [Spirochaetales bacterium]
MHVLLVNTSPHQKGCTNRALEEVAATLNALDVTTEILWIGNDALHGCTDCRHCFSAGVCAFDDGMVNVAVEKVLKSDGLIVGSPVHYASMCGAGSSFMDRLFRTASKRMAHKPAAAVVSCRRGGASAAFDRINKYFAYSSMPIVPSTYWNSVHGSSAEEVERDEEGLQVMRNLARNMAWMLQSLKKTPAPELERTFVTNYIR